MLINNENNTGKIKFISYEHKLALCYGELKLEFNDKVYTFNKKNNTTFWSSGGSVGFYNNYDKSYVNTGDWIIDVSILPDELKEYASEIDYIFQKNIPKGCCGACL